LKEGEKEGKRRGKERREQERKKRSFLAHGPHLQCSCIFHLKEFHLFLFIVYIRVPLFFQVFILWV
jgi:hypothetical protein